MIVRKIVTMNIFFEILCWYLIFSYSCGFGINLGYMVDRYLEELVKDRVILVVMFLLSPILVPVHIGVFLVDLYYWYKAV